MNIEFPEWSGSNGLDFMINAFIIGVFSLLMFGMGNMIFSILFPKPSVPLNLAILWQVNTGLPNVFWLCFGVGFILHGLTIVRVSSNDRTTIKEEK